MNEARRRWAAFADRPRSPLILLGVVTLLSTALRLLWISNPEALLFDENYYVSAARTILGVPVESDQLYSTAPDGLDPNFSHPPLGKLLISLGIRAFGDDPLGWRFAAIVFGAFALLAMYWLARSADLGAWSSLGAASLMAADPMFFIHGRTGMLEVFVLTFMLVAAAVYMGDRPGLAGVVVGVGACVKLVALFLLPAFLVLEVLRVTAGARAQRQLPKRRREKSWLRRTLRDRIRTIALTWSIATVVYFSFLQLLDMRFTTFHNSIHHTYAMITSFQTGTLDQTVIDRIAPLAGVGVEAGRSLQDRIARGQLLVGAEAQRGSPRPASVEQDPHTAPGGPVIRQKGQNIGLAPNSSPVQWLFNEEPILYYRAPADRGEIRSPVLLGQRTPYSTFFYVLVNPAIIVLAVLALILSFRTAWQQRRPDGFLPSAWFAGVFGVFVLSDAFRPEASGHLYYMLAILPAIYIAIAELFQRPRLRRLVPLYAALVFLFFVLNFPFRTWGGA